MRKVKIGFQFLLPEGRFSDPAAEPGAVFVGGKATASQARRAVSEARASRSGVVCLARTGMRS